MPECDAPATEIDWTARAAALAPRLAAEADRIEADGRVPAELMGALHEAGLFRLCLPRALGGAEAAPIVVASVLETLAAADASTAWCLGQGLGCSLAAGFVAPDAAGEIFGPPDAVLAWGPPNGTGHAARVDGGYRLTGRWSFASGIRNATWIGAHARVRDPGAAAPAPAAQGRRGLRTFLFPASEAEIHPVWDTIGLRGTGSDDYEVRDLFVPDSRSYVRDLVRDRRGPSPVHRIPQTTFFGMAFAGVALGIARGLLDAFMALAVEKTPSYATGPLAGNAAVRQRVARREGDLGGARAFLFERMAERWEAARRDEAPSLRSRALLRIACTNATLRAREAADFAYASAGAAAVHRRNPFERRFRDMNAVAQQVQAAPSNLEDAGAALFGVETGGRV